MPPPKHIAQTSTEVKKAYKTNGSVLSERTHKQLQRGYELEQRAARERESEQRRKLAKEKRLEREKKEQQIRKQIGVGLATQLIGYSHTQAHLKKGMEAFLGINKKKQDEERRRKDEEKRREEELAKKLEAIAQDIEKEPFDDDDDIDDAILDLPITNVQGGSGWVDDELDDDTLLEVHDMLMSDPAEEPAIETICAPQQRNPSESQPLPDVLPAQHTESHQAGQGVISGDVDFTRIHGPLNKAVESVLEKMPGEVFEILSQDNAADTTDWMPAYGLLHKLNPIGLPPHRLRIKIGCVLICLKDLNTSSQLSKSQHVQVTRIESERLECLTLDGQLAGTKTVITRVPFAARYRNDDKFPFTRTQYPVRVATDFTLADQPQEGPPSGFKIPSINGRVRPPIQGKRPSPPVSKPKSQIGANPSFKLPGLPASKAQVSSIARPSASSKATTNTSSALDGWDDFLDSGTQIARELSAETNPTPSLPQTVNQPVIGNATLPPLSTQDLDFSLDDLEDDRPTAHVHVPEPGLSPKLVAKAAPPIARAAILNRAVNIPLSVKPGPLSRTANLRRLDAESGRSLFSAVRPQKMQSSKTKRPLIPPPQKPLPPPKKPCLVAPPLACTTATTTTTSRCFSEFGMSTQEATCFFEDDDELISGSPPIAT